MTTLIDRGIVLTSWRQPGDGSPVTWRVRLAARPGCYWLLVAPEGATGPELFGRARAVTRSAPATPDADSLCPESEARAAMSDGEFWEHVYGLDGLDGYDPDDDMNAPPPDEIEPAGPCPVCGSTGACDADTEGRPLIHAVPVDDDEEAM